jgi:ribose transport system permease protein
MLTLNEKPEGAMGEVAAGAVGTQRLTFNSFVLKYNSLIILFLLIVVSAIISPIFLTKNNIVNVFRQQSTYVIISMGMIMTLLTGGIDLSVASMAGVGCVMIPWVCDELGLGMGWAIIVTLLSCTAFGAISGALVAFLNMAPFIVTLAMSFGLQGFAYIITNAITRFVSAEDALSTFMIAFGQKSDPLIGIPYRVYLAVAVVAAVWFVLKYTAFGRLCMATGSNPVAVKLAGVNISKYRFIVYIISGFLAGLAGIMIAFGNGAATPTICSGDYAMATIAGAVIGGAAMEGGRGSALLTVVGVFVIGLINNIMNLMSVPAWPQWCVKAAVILLAIFLRSVTDKRR